MKAIRFAGTPMVRVPVLSVIALVLGSSFAVATDDFAGKWVNTDQKTGGLTRLEIAKNDKSWTIQAWGAGGNGEFDQGKVALHLLVDLRSGIEPKNGIAYWDHMFKDTRLTLRLENDELVVEDFNVFKDNSGRRNYLITYKFKKDK